jgi:hypothetical protein
MRHLVFLAIVAGALFAVDTFKFRGRYRAEIWQEVMYKSYTFNRDLEYRLKRTLWYGKS